MDIYKDESYSFEERAADLVSRMTLEEKIMQVGNNASAIPRLGLPRYDYWSEASHGFFGPFEVKPMDVTSYPVCLAMSQSWDREKIKEVTTAISDEIRAHHNLNDVELHMWCPTINLARDPRNGRSDENFGEDPVLAGKMAASYIQGLQGEGDGTPYLKAVATPKHYALNSSENNRHTGSSNVDEATLREYYTKQFQYAIREGGAQSIMTSYNRINGVPASGNDMLLTTLLREEWGFDGVVVSDCGAVADMYFNPMFSAATKLGHYYAKNMEEASAMSLIAGTDISCGSEHKKALMNAVEQGLISEDVIDRAIIRALVTRFRLGLFDDPAKVAYNKIGSECVASEAMAALSVDMANDTIVLLKNDKKLLPIDKKAYKKILVVGPNALYRQLGGYSAGQTPIVDTLVNIMALDGIRNEVKDADIEVSYEKGWCTGEEFGKGGIMDALPGFDPADLMIDINPGLDDPMAGLMAAFGAGGEQPPKRWTVEDPDFQADEEPLFAKALAAAKEADLVIVIAGTDASNASEEHDRNELALPYGQDEKIQKLLEVNDNTVVVITALGAVTGEFFGKAHTIVNAHFAGQAQGTAIANVLFGKVNPNAKLSATWYKDVKDLPALNDYAIKPQDSVSKQARTYMYMDKEVLFPFGHGLSYSDFSYSNLRVNKEALDANDCLTVCVDVTNNSKVDGKEIVQLYVSKILTGKQRDNKPIRQLKGWAKELIPAGQTRTVEITIPVSDISFWSNLKKEFVVEPGTYKIEIGASSADIRECTEVSISGTWDAQLAYVYVLADKYCMNVGEKSQLKVSATLENTRHLCMQCNRPVFTSSDPAVASVDENGGVTALASGTALITASVTYEGKTVSKAVPVAVR
ncbi:MAG: glycoside hydrolase family 3 C-terminal domain-containing protein [Lachnospiraceae bacterium]|nr:glycoside hydrolase family 3 C-terminal domain-containing protein [Lachnospiraceae bacterium]